MVGLELLHKCYNTDVLGVLPIYPYSLSLLKGLAIFFGSAALQAFAGHTGDVLDWVRMDLTSLLQYAGNALQTNIL